MFQTGRIIRERDKIFFMAVGREVILLAVQLDEFD
jgi:hypothetical protein